jgi:ATP-dependent DNA ligase
MARGIARRRRTDPPALPEWIQPQLTQLVDAAPNGPDWLHEIKFDGYRMHARLDRGAVRLLTRTGLDWTRKYPAIAAAVSSIGARQAYLDGELCEARADGITSSNVSSARQYCDQQIGHGRAFHEKACAMSLEGIVSKRADAAYAPGNRGLWVKVKCLHREEFVVVAWTDQRF